MSKKVAERFTWAVETLAIAPDDRLLEIGCGHGIAVGLICEGVQDGKITAIDRSESMIEVATKQNQSHIAAGKVIFQAVSIKEANFAEESFNKIFAINVNLSGSDLAMIKTLLTTDGTFYLFQQPPIASKTQVLADHFTKLLEDNGFSIREVTFRNIAPVRSVCLMARKSNL